MPVEALSAVPAYSFPPDWYDAASADHFWMAWRLEAFRRLLRDCAVPTESHLRGLDIGCGSGVVQAQIEDATRWTPDGADINAQALALNRGGRGRVLLYDIHDRRPELRERYDMLVLFDVIEHIEEPGHFLASALAHVKPGGWVFVNVPAVQALFSAYDEAAGHYRRYDRSSLTRALERAGLAITDMRYWGASLVPLLVLRSLLLAIKRRRDVIGFGFTPPARWVNGALKDMMRVELALLRRPFLGTSLMAAARKPVR
jgi:2-polyprenyl-3-methyl-5-hydroxy-6-metoxy-1,4-benzoquinol methylase